MPPIRSIARFIWNELRKPYGWPGIILWIIVLLLIGGAFYVLPRIIGGGL